MSKSARKTSTRPKRGRSAPKAVKSPAAGTGSFAVLDLTSNTLIGNRLTLAEVSSFCRRTQAQNWQILTSEAAERWNRGKM